MLRRHEYGHEFGHFDGPNTKRLEVLLDGCRSREREWFTRRVRISWLAGEAAYMPDLVSRTNL